MGLGSPRYANFSMNSRSPDLVRLFHTAARRRERAPLAMSCSFATVSSCALLLFARHAHAFQLAPSSFQSARVKTGLKLIDSQATTASWATLAARPPRRRRRQRSFGTMSLSDPGGSGDGGVGGGDSWLSEWKRSLVAASLALSVFGGSVLTTSPAGLLPLQDGGGRSSGSVAMAAMAPSLMQDEKGYISIFEKVGCAFTSPYLCTAWCSRLSPSGEAQISTKHEPTFRKHERPEGRGCFLSAHGGTHATDPTEQLQRC